MNLYSYIFKRKSTRKYHMQPLNQETLDNIQNYITTLTPLSPNIKVEFGLADNNQTKNLLPIKAPYYFVISSEVKEGYLENVGFMGQQLDLYLSSQNLGSCWLGLAKTKSSFKTNLEFVIILAFGQPEGNPYRELSEFKRKSLAEIADFKDPRLEPGRLAPSATNSQNWHFTKTEKGINLYRKKLNPLENLAYGKMNSIDMGIVLCHIYLATLEQNSVFEIFKIPHPQILPKLDYVCTILD